MRFRVGHEIRYQLIVEAANEREAASLAESKPYTEWDHSYLVMEDVIPLEESPVNPQAE